VAQGEGPEFKPVSQKKKKKKKGGFVLVRGRMLLAMSSMIMNSKYVLNKLMCCSVDENLLLKACSLMFVLGLS
jgi:hypothetical protein